MAIRDIDEEIRAILRFTEVYRKHQDSDIATREAACLKVQFPAAMGRMRGDDDFAGRLEALPVGISPQQYALMGYYMDEDRIRELLKADISLARREALIEMRAFWRGENTIAKIKRFYDDALWEALPDKNYLYDHAAAYPLYRISGTHLDFGTLLKHGVRGLQSRITERRAMAADNTSRNLYAAMITALDVFSDVCRFYQSDVERLLEHCDATGRRAHLQRLRGSLERIATEPAGGFMDAIQMCLIYWHMSGSLNWGRMDTYLADYYVGDVDSGRITEDEALDLLCGMWRNMSVRRLVYDTRVVVGGQGRSDPAGADRFTLLAIKASMKVRDVIPQLTLRFSADTPESVMSAAYEAIGTGLTFPLLYCDEVNVPAVQQAFQLPYEEAVDYCPFGCGEYVIFHRSVGTPSGLINLLKILEITLNDGCDMLTGERLGPAGDAPGASANVTTDGMVKDTLGGTADNPTGGTADDPTGSTTDDPTDGTTDAPTGSPMGAAASVATVGFKTFEELWDAYCRNVEYFAEQLARQEELEYQGAAATCPFLYLSILFDDCIERGRGILDGGARYLGGTLESYGNINTSDSLLAIKRLVFDKKAVTMETLRRALKSDFDGYENIRALLLKQPKFGNDDEEADGMAVMVHEQICRAAIEAGKATSLHSYLIVIINNNANSVLGKLTSASADGRKAFTFLANANNPYRGGDKTGLTAMLNSLVKLKSGIHAGCVQNIKFSKEMFIEHRDLARAVMSAYFAGGGSQAMLSVVGKEDLENAMREPDKYKNLIVRVGGFSARFVELGFEERKEILARTIY